MFMKKRDLKNVIKKPVNAYISYYKQRFAEIKSHNPGKNTRELSKLISQQWNNLEKDDKEEKALYIKEY